MGRIFTYMTFQTSIVLVFSAERRVALMLQCLRPRVEKDVGPLAWLDAPDQFPDYGCSRLESAPTAYLAKAAILYQIPPPTVKSAKGEFRTSQPRCLSVWYNTNRESEGQKTLLQAMSGDDADDSGRDALRRVRHARGAPDRPLGRAAERDV